MSGIENKVNRALSFAVEKTFAEMAFIDAAPTAQSLTDLSAGQLIHIGFARPVEGQITLYLAASLKRLIVENIFGKSWEETEDDEIDDCLLELLNVLAGNFLKELGESEEKHSISLPQLLYDDSKFEDLTDISFFDYDAEGHPFRVSVYYPGNKNKQGVIQ